MCLKMRFFISLSITLYIDNSNQYKENTWKNLDKIWTLLHDEVKFKEYVRDEIKALLEDETS